MLAVLRFVAAAMFVYLVSPPVEGFRLDCAWACEHGVANGVCRCFAKRQSYDPDYESLFAPQFDLDEPDHTANAMDDDTVGSYIFRWGKRSHNVGFVRPKPSRWSHEAEPGRDNGKKVQPRRKIDSTNNLM
ncbi:hypothetical protein LSAT2_019781 [Lamellibrachia satsuma]|nr:hypothetical protein LSAT2_019781 [Lamellibrachia satsuma]